MSNIYLNITIEKKWCTQNFNFPWSRSSPPGKFLGSSTHINTIEFSNIFLQVKNQSFGSKTVCGFSIILFMKGVMTL